MITKFNHERRAHSPSHPRVAITCSMCGHVHQAQFLMRRVVRHIEDLKSPVRITLVRKCPRCKATLSTKVRVSADRTIDWNVQTTVSAFGGHS
jgi:RNase P subunit RPR2